MNQNFEPSRFGALRGMVYMRLKELETTFSVFRIVGVFALSFGLLMLLSLDSDEAKVRFLDLVTGVFALTFVPIFCLTKGGESLREELKDGTIEYLWVRPASKIELYCGFYLSALISSLSTIIPSLLGLSLAGMFMGAISVGGLTVLWLTVLFVSATFTAISGALGAWSSKFVVFSLFYYGFVELGLGAIPNGVQRLAVSFHTKQLLNGVSIDGSAGPTELSSLLWVFGAGLIGLVAGAAIFSQSRYVVGSEKEA